MSQPVNGNLSFSDAQEVLRLAIVCPAIAKLLEVRGDLCSLVLIYDDNSPHNPRERLYSDWQSFSQQHGLDLLEELQAMLEDELGSEWEVRLICGNQEGLYSVEAYRR